MLPGPGPRPRLHGHLIHLQTDMGPGGIFAYAYLLDWTAAQRRTLSSSTFGLRFQGETGLENLDLLYFAEYARQQEYGSNPGSFDLDYVHFGPSMAGAPLGGS